MTDFPLPIAVLISGSGSNLQALIDAQDAERGYVIAVVISDRPGVRGLERAADAGIPTEVVEWADFGSRDLFTAALCDVADQVGAKGLVLAGFMRILAPNAIERFPTAIINVHPALLPAFPGAHAVEAAIEYGVKLTGVTVHFVDEEVDHGPIIVQEPINVAAEDDPTSLHSRIQEIEHLLLPEAVSAFARGDLTVHGRHVHWDRVSEEAIG